MNHSEVSTQCTRLSERHVAHSTLEWSRVDVTLVMHNQTCALLERHVARFTRWIRIVSVETLEMSLERVSGCAKVFKFSVGVIRKDFQASVCLSTGHCALHRNTKRVFLLVLKSTR